MKRILILMLGLSAISGFGVSVLADEDYLQYDIPPNAKVLGPLHTENPKEEYFNYFRPDSGVIRGNLIAQEIYSSGKLVERKLYKDRLKHGVQRTWYMNGKQRFEAPYKNGVMHGV